MREGPDRCDDVIVASFEQPVHAPVAGYKLAHVEPGPYRGTGSSSTAPSTWVVRYPVLDDAGDTGPGRPAGRPAVFQALLHQVNFEDHPTVEVTVACWWEPTEALVQARAAEHTAALQGYDQERQRSAKEALVAGVRERVELAGRVAPRPSEDLREEERILVFRRILDRLLGGATGPDAHLLSERIRAIFDVSQMLYFVAPDWWQPRRDAAEGLPLPEVSTDGQIELGPPERVRFGGAAAMRPGNYLVTESSRPAPLGSSIGWLVQLDGDALRNAFLNAPWVKAVLPVRPGRELAAIEWLKQPHVEGSDGLDADAVDERGRRTGQTIEDRLRAAAREIAVKAGEDERYAAEQRVFETGFDPLRGGLGLGGEPLDVFAQWVEVVPTRQVVPVPYPSEAPPG